MKPTFWSGGIFTTRNEQMWLVDFPVSPTVQGSKSIFQQKGLYEWKGMGPRLRYLQNLLWKKFYFLEFARTVLVRLEYVILKLFLEYCGTIQRWSSPGNYSTGYLEGPGFLWFPQLHQQVCDCAAERTFRENEERFIQNYYFIEIKIR